jgi:uncharacterized protein YrrD
MQVDIQAPVYCADDTHVGKVDRVVIDPDAQRVTHIVIHKGTWLSHDIVVPLDEVERADEQGVHLRLTPEQVDGLPDFVEVEWAQPREGWVPPPEYFESVVLWPPYFGQPAAPTTEHLSIGEHEVAITEGTDVECTDGKIGVVDRVLLDAQTQRLEGFVVREGVILTHDVVIPVRWIADTSPDVVRLNVSKDQVAREAQRPS